MILRRRDLLRSAALGLLAVPLVGCSREGGEVALEDIGGDAAPALEIGDAESELLAGTSRYAFGLRDADGPLVADDVVVHVGRDPARPAETRVAARRLTEEVGDRGLYVAQVPFPDAGAYFVAIVATLSDGTRLKGGVRVTVKASSTSPTPGQQVPAIPTPTTAKPLGADPLCSRSPAPCSMHEVSLDRALRSGKPTVVVFAAPAYCATELCGPDVEIVERIAREKAGRANFIHVEAYRKRGKELAPALRSLKFTTEPWIYFVAADGVVSDRISGAFASVEVRDRLAKLGA